MKKVSKTAVLDKPMGQFLIKEYEVPVPHENEFILKTELAALCGTDVHIYYGHSDVDFPIVLGHEFCGIIDQLGDNVREDTNGNPVKEGDRVVIAPHIPCGECFYCKIVKTPTVCPFGPCYGLMPNVEPNLLIGGFSQYVHIKFPNTSFFKTNLDPEIAVLAEPLSVSVHGFQRAGGVRFGSTVVIQGTGAIGLGTIAFAKLSGAGKIIAVGGPEQRLKIAKELGADVTINIEKIIDPEERIKVVKSETLGKRGADMVVECAGFPMALPEGLEYLRDSGKYIELGHFTDTGSVEINPHKHMVKKNVDIHAVWGDHTEHIQMALSVMERKELPFEKIASPRVSLENIHRAVEAIGSRTYKLDNKEVIKVVVDPWE